MTDYELLEIRERTLPGTDQARLVDALVMAMTELDAKNEMLAWVRTQLDGLGRPESEDE